MKRRTILMLTATVLLLGLLSGCGEQSTGYLPPATEAVDTVDIEEEAVALAQLPPALPVSVSAQQGELVERNERAAIDYSHTAQGYVMVYVERDSGRRWKAQVKGPTTTYTYNLTPQLWAAFPFSDGNGDYQITVYENVSGNSYAAVLVHSCTVTLENEFAPFLHANQFVDYDAAPNTVAKAAELTAQSPDALAKVAAIYEYVVKEMTYDRELAATAKSGYLPVLDTVLEKKSGICFDYAALMTGMLRSQGVPCKLVVGYAGTVYHAWISVWTQEHGWVDSVVYFNGSTWQRMDPTFASNGGKDPAILRYIGDGSNYTARYFY